jgi:hypothetical protein
MPPFMLWTFYNFDWCLNLWCVQPFWSLSTLTVMKKSVSEVRTLWGAFCYPWCLAGWSVAECEPDIPIILTLASLSEMREGICFLIIQNFYWFYLSKKTCIMEFEVPRGLDGISNSYSYEESLGSRCQA